MIITRTPFRISFFGGGTDYPSWFRENGGAVLSTTIDKYCYISMRLLPPFFAHKHRVVYSKIEIVESADEIEHPAVRAVLKWANFHKGLEIHHDGDLPARAGLGSSSAFTVGMAQALSSLQGRFLPRNTLASEAIEIEQNIIKENVGSQDQISAAYGGLNKITFHRDNSFEVSPVVLPVSRQRQFQQYLMLFFTGLSRTASEVAKNKIENFRSKAADLHEMRQQVDLGLDILQNPSTEISDLGRLLHEGWMLKRGLASSVSSTTIDEIYAIARQSGALGGKLLGAGGGGFMLLFVPPELQKKVRLALESLVYVPFSFEQTGAKVIFYQSQEGEVYDSFGGEK